MLFPQPPRANFSSPRSGYGFPMIGKPYYPDSSETISPHGDDILVLLGRYHFVTISSLRSDVKSGTANRLRRF